MSAKKILLRPRPIVFLTTAATLTVGAWVADLVARAVAEAIVDWQAELAHEEDDR